MLGPLIILVALVKIMIGQGYSMSSKFVGINSINPLFNIYLNREMDTLPKH